MNKLILCLLGAILALAASCTSPLTSLGGGGTASAVQKTNETLLVFQIGASSIQRAITGDSYLTVQLKSQAEGTVKFASATKSGATYTVSVGGLVAGIWNLRVMLYDSLTAQNLLYYANTSTYITVGSTNTVPVSLYVPGSVNGLTLSEASVAQHVAIEDPDGLPGGGAAKPVPVGQSWDLDATAWSNAGGTVPATQPGVFWSSSNEDVALVSSSGKVTVLNTGTATITAVSVENATLSSNYDIVGVPAVVGSWIMPPSGKESTAITFTETGFVIYEWDAFAGYTSDRGTYTYANDILQLHVEERLDLATLTWAPKVSGEVNSAFFTRLTATSLELIPYMGMKSAVGRTSVNSISLMGMLFIKARPFVPLTGISVGGKDGQPAEALSVALGSTIAELVTSAFPANASVPALVWSSAAPTVFGYNKTLDSEFAARTLGSATITAYSIADLTTPVAVFNVTVVPNLAPSVTRLTPSTNEVPTGDTAFSFQITDETRVYQVSYGVGSPSYSSFVDQASPYTLNFTLPNLTDGTTVVLVDARDNHNVSKIWKFPILVGTARTDAVVPSVGFVNLSPTFTYGSVHTGYNVQLTDDLSGIDPASVTYSLDGTTAAAGGIASLDYMSGDYAYLKLDLTGVSTPISGAVLTIQFSDYRGNTNSATYNFNSNAP